MNETKSKITATTVVSKNNGSIDNHSVLMSYTICPSSNVFIKSTC